MPNPFSYDKGDVDEIADEVRRTLNGGVQFGYVQRHNNKYTLARTDFTEMNDNEEGAEALQDRVRKRRRNSGGRRSSRSRSRSRRNSRRRSSIKR